MSGAPAPSPLTNLGNTIQMVSNLTALSIGVLGNVFVVLVMTRPGMRTNSASCYFTVLALSDLGVLLSAISSDLLGWNRLGYGNSYNIYTCILPIFFIRTCGGTSLWLLVALGVDRLIAVKMPLKAKQLCTVRRAAMVSVIIFIFQVLKSCPLLWIRGEQTLPGPNNTTIVINCGYVSEQAKDFLTRINPLLSLIIAAILPIGSVTTLNILIIHELRKMSRFVSGWLFHFACCSRSGLIFMQLPFI